MSSIISLLLEYSTRSPILHISVYLSSLCILKAVDLESFQSDIGSGCVLGVSPGQVDAFEYSSLTRTCFNQGVSLCLAD